MIGRILTAFVSVAIVATPATAKVALAPYFTDHVVIQRDRPIIIGGTADAYEKLNVRLADKTISVTAASDGAWQAKLPAMPAGGPYDLSVSSSDGRLVAIASDVMLGDVWLCSGQSNMEFPVRRALDSDNQIANAGNVLIRLLEIPQTTSAEPSGQFGRAVAWRLSAPDSVPEFSAACYHMVRELQATRGVAIGAIDASWGGTAIRAWLDPAGAQKIYGKSEVDLLDLYGRDPLAANAAFFPRWAYWYQQAANNAPWVDSTKLDWKPVPSIEFWDKWGDPAFQGFNGTIWMRRTITLTVNQAKQVNQLSLGVIDDVDETFINGTAIGNTFSWSDPRNYVVPARLWKAGENDILVAITNSYGTGGFSGPAEALKLTLGDGSTIALGDGWEYAVGTRQGGTPRPPWDQIAGLGLIHNRMIAPLGPIQLDGVAWYQGESDVGMAHYDDRLRALIEGWRRQFARADLSVLVVGLANYGPSNPTTTESGWAMLRDEQRRAADTVAGATLVPALDIGERLDLHPANKTELGHRLARAAGGKPLPRVIDATRQGNHIIIRFDGVTGALASWSSNQAIGFELCGDVASSCRFASAVADGATVRIAGDGKLATRVRYAWADAPVVNLFDADNMPISSFEIPIR